TGARLLLTLRAVWRLLLGAGLLLLAPADTGVDEVLDLPVEHGSSVALLVLGTQVLDHLVGLQHVRAHLVAPGGLDVAGERLLRGVLLLLALEQQAGLEHPQRSEERRVGTEGS